MLTEFFSDKIADVCSEDIDLNSFEYNFTS